MVCIAPVPETIAPAISSTRSAFSVTLPDATVKSVESKLAIPLFVSVASSADIVIVLFDTAVSIPSPPAKFSVSLISDTASGLPESAVTFNIVDMVVKLTVPLPSVISACPSVPSVNGSE